MDTGQWIALSVVASAILLGILLPVLRRRWASPMAAAGWGLVVGLGAGLSASPILAGILSTVTAVAVAYFGSRASPDGHSSARVCIAACVHVPFVLILGLLCGISLRANNALEFRPKHIPTRLAELGFTGTQIGKIMESLCTASAVELLGHAESVPQTHLLAQGRSSGKITSQQLQALALRTPDELEWVASSADLDAVRFVALQLIKGRTLDEAKTGLHEWLTHRD